MKKFSDLSPLVQRIALTLTGIVAGLILAVTVFKAQAIKDHVSAYRAALFGPSEYPSRLTKSQINAFKAEMGRVKVAPDRALRRIKATYLVDCKICASDANKMTRIINATPGWKITSMTAQFAAGNPKGVIIKTRKLDAAASEDLKAIEGLLTAAQIPYKVAESEIQFDEEFLLFFGE